MMTNEGISIIARGVLSFLVYAVTQTSCSTKTMGLEIKLLDIMYQARGKGSTKEISWKEV